MTIPLLSEDIQMATLVRATPERVYQALTQPEEINQWFTSDATGESKPGSVLVWRWKDWGPDRVTTEDHLDVLEAVPNQRFASRWHPVGSQVEAVHTTTVSVDFEQVETGTVVRLRETGYLDTPEHLKACLNCATGWGEALTLLKFYVEHGIRY